MPAVKPPVGTIVCPGCGGGAPETAKACPYCGAKVVVPPPPGVAIDATAALSEPRTFCARCALFYAATLPSCPRCPPASADAVGGRCPRCQLALESETRTGVSLDACPKCDGLWFDGNELERTIDLTTRGKSRDEVHALRPDLPWHPSPIEKGTLDCVRCRTPMQRRQIAPKTGVVVDVCRVHGIWLDAGEWEQFVEFVRAGGLEVLRRDMETNRPKRMWGRKGPMSRRTYFPGDDGAPDIGFFLTLLGSVWH
jgi:Zn-finger nucleic acid-binding protein